MSPGQDTYSRRQVTTIERPRSRWKNSPALPGEAYMPTQYEQCGNVISHAIPLVLSVVGVVELLERSRTRAQFFVAAVYGTFLCALFLSSTGFHFCCLIERYPRARKILHFFDRMVIYLFIAASYMPWLLLTQTDYDMLMKYACGVMWFFAACGTVHQFRCVVTATCVHHRLQSSASSTSVSNNSASSIVLTDSNHNSVRARVQSAVDGEKTSEEEQKMEQLASDNQLEATHPQANHHRMPHVPPTVVFYVAYATCPAVILCAVHQSSGLFELALGGSFYLLGVVFFKLDGILPLAHTVWHTFVTFGAATQFFAIRSHFYTV